MMQPQNREEYPLAMRLLGEMNRLRRVSTAGQPPPIKRGDMAVLGALAEMEKKGVEATPSGMARVLHQTPSAISQRLAKLEGAGYIRRKTDKSDRRSSHIQLTAKGKKLSTRSVDRFFQRMENSLLQMGQSEAEKLLQLMHQLSENLDGETLREEGGAPC